METACPTCGGLWLAGYTCALCCVVCRQLDRECASCLEPKRAAILFREYVKHVLSHSPKVKTHNGNGTHCGAWAFTLTSSPSDNMTVDDLIGAAKKLMSQKSCPVKRFAWYLEYKDEGKHPHIHGMYECENGGRIEAKHFKRAWPIWNEKERLGMGFRGGYHRPVRHNEAYSDYIAKDGGVGESA